VPISQSTLAMFIISEFNEKVNFSIYLPYFGYLLLWSHSIWVPIAAHFMNNATIVLFYFFMKEDENPAALDLETVGADGALPWVVGSVILFALLVVMLFKQVHPERKFGKKITMFHYNS